MKRKEVEKVIKTMLSADGECKYYVADLLKLFCKEFPEYKEPAKKIFQERFGKELNCSKSGK